MQSSSFQSKKIRIKKLGHTITLDFLASVAKSVVSVEVGSVGCCLQDYFEGTDTANLVSNQGTTSGTVDKLRCSVLLLYLVGSGTVALSKTLLTLFPCRLKKGRKSLKKAYVLNLIITDHEPVLFYLFSLVQSRAS